MKIASGGLYQGPVIPRDFEDQKWLKGQICIVVEVKINEKPKLESYHTKKELGPWLYDACNFYNLRSNR